MSDRPFSEPRTENHLRRALAVSAFLAVALASTGAPAEASVAALGRGVEHWSSGLPATSVRLEDELLRAREASARYHDVEVAMAEGYVQAGPYVPRMGYHYVNESLIDDRFEPDRPEILLYAETGPGGALELVAVEYGVPLALSEFAPDGFAGEFDQWTRDEHLGLWTLHAWVWMRNPDGIFEAQNPDIP